MQNIFSFVVINHIITIKSQCDILCCFKSVISSRLKIWPLPIYLRGITLEFVGKARKKYSRSSGRGNISANVLPHMGQSHLGDTFERLEMAADPSPTSSVTFKQSLHIAGTVLEKIQPKGGTSFQRRAQKHANPHHLTPKTGHPLIVPWPVDSLYQRTGQAEGLTHN